MTEQMAPSQPAPSPQARWAEGSWAADAGVAGASGAAVDGAADGAADVADTVDLLALMACTELAAFSRLSADSSASPGLSRRLHLARMAGAALGRQERLMARIAELGGDPEASMAPFGEVFAEFDARTVPADWPEGVLKGYVGHGVAEDFCRLAASGLDDGSRALVGEVVEDGLRASRSVELLADMAREDGVLASRLALWGRRLVGESLGVVQGLMTRHPGLSRLVAHAAVDAPGADPRSWAFSRLTAEHTRRMDRLGLAA